MNNGELKLVMTKELVKIITNRRIKSKITKIKELLKEAEKHDFDIINNYYIESDSLFDIIYPLQQSIYEKDNKVKQYLLHKHAQLEIEYTINGENKKRNIVEDIIIMLGQFDIDIYNEKTWEKLPAAAIDDIKFYIKQKNYFMNEIEKQKSFKRAVINREDDDDDVSEDNTSAGGKKYRKTKKNKRKYNKCIRRSSKSFKKKYKN